MNHSKTISLFLVLSLLCGCKTSSVSTPTPTASQPNESVNETVEEPVQETEAVQVTAMARPSFLDVEFAQKTGNASAESVELAADLSNVVNLGMFYLNDAQMQDLQNQYFSISQGWDSEFFEIYENNMYMSKANFITVDSLMHTFHLYYQYLQKNSERTYLSGKLFEMSQIMYENSSSQYNALKGTEWESAALRNVRFFSIGLDLIKGNEELSDDVIAQELSAIYDASGIGPSVLMTTDEEYLQDYSQFKPRGYYTESEDLERYFRTMMWYGQMNFATNKEDLNRSALLMNLALNGAKDQWETVYEVTSFLSGESDDATYYEFMPVIESAYGKIPSTNDLISNPDGFSSYVELCKQMDPPKINSIVLIQNGEDTVEERNEKTIGFRILGQRFTIDANILQRLVYREVRENSNGEQRLLPSGLDVCAAMGSEEAWSILEEEGNTEFENYTENMDKMKEVIAESTDEEWGASIYSAWLKTLKPLLDEKGEGYPEFMQNKAWDRKNLASYLGSYAELKHDSILYAKQIMAEMGGAGFEDVQDDRGYVEPEPEVFGNLANLCEALTQGLKNYGLISSDDMESMNNLKDLAAKLKTIAEKELAGQLPTDEEFDLIRSYGGQLEHLWTKTLGDQDYYKAMEHPNPIVADIATDPNGYCLEIGTGKPSYLYVLVPFDGVYHLCSGSVFSYYEFEQPISDRLTDEEWRDRLSEWNNPVAMPEWEQAIYAN
ncbi:MAG: DUF3160 domain-containing protein [Solobacterium sp.]|nr:DUF3160 domain-containing protein [Solobacterium sp.]